MTNTDMEPGLNLPAVSGGCRVDPPTPRDPTAAERQRRYRQRKGVTHAPVMRDDRNALTVTSPVTSRVTNGDVTILCAAQDKIEITFDDDGDAIITQTRWPDEEQIIIVSRDNLDSFIDKLTDAFGIGSFGRP